ncbi:MAG: tetratricopeptide repeat protein [Cyclobacteriaceae bacterium]|nr:tetratricopeptide repeat protein [Cyclobacteriaceae bacterium]
MCINIKNVFCLLSVIIISPLLYAQNAEEIAIANEYYEQADYDKAYDVYSRLIRSPQNIQFVHNNYYNLLLNTGRLDEAEKYIQRQIKREPDNIYYKIDYGLINVQRNDKNAEQKYFSELIKSLAGDSFKVRLAAQYFSRVQLHDYSVELYKSARKKSGKYTEYALQLASIYRLMNKRDDMIIEYLNFADENPANLNAVKNILQSILNSEEDLESFETLMIDRVQKQPDNPNNTDLLIWVNLQQRNFYGAFIQARAIDRRYKLGGMRLMEIGSIALDNQDYNNAIRIFEYVIDQYKGSQNYQIARRLVIKAREEKVKNTYPVNYTEIEKLISDYQNLIDEVGINQYTSEAVRSMALLYAFYLDDKEKSSYLLKRIIETPRMNKSIVDRSKLDLGDIFLLNGEPWESTLLYSQVEKSSKETPIAFEAKLKNAKLSYFKGEFQLAQEHLDVLKNATTREIANDAMALSLLIKDNTIIEESDEAMKRYANIELLLFQNKKKEALDSLTVLYQENPNHSLADEILFLKSKINIEIGRFSEAITLLEKITVSFADDILSDDALFLMAKVYEENLKDKNMAMDLYEKFLRIHPGSIYTSEARKRFRTLRGDFINQP